MFNTNFIFYCCVMLPLLLLHPNLKNTQNMQLSTGSINAIKILCDSLNAFKIAYNKSGISSKKTPTTTDIKYTAKYNAVCALEAALTAAIVPKKAEAEGVSLKKKEDIGKHQFIQFVEQWVDDFKQTLAKLEDENPSISITAVSNFLKGKIGDKKFPVSQIFWQHIDKELKGLGEENTPKNIADAIVRALDGVQIDLATEFVNNKPIYKKIKKEDLAAVTKNQDIKKLIIAPIEFYDWMIAEAKADAEKAKADAEKAKADFEEKFSNFIENLRGAVNSIKIQNPNAAQDTSMVDIDLFFSNFDKAVEGAKTSSEPTIANMKAYLTKEVGGQKFCELEEMKSALNSWTNLNYPQENWYAKQYTNWKNDKRLPSYNLIAAAINDAYIDINIDTVLGKLSNWTNEVRGAFVFEEIFKVDIEKAKKNLAELFAESQSGISTEFIYKNFLSDNLSKAPNPSTVKVLEDLVWESGLQGVRTRKGIEGLYVEWIKAHGPYLVKDFSDSLGTILPSVSEVQQALRMSKWQTKSLVLPEITQDSLLPLIKITSKTLLGDKVIEGNLHIKVKYKNIQIALKDKIEDVLFAVPTSVEWLPNEEWKESLKLISSSIAKPTVAISGSLATSSCFLKLKFKITVIEKKLLGILNANNIAVYDENGGNISYGDIMKGLKDLNIIEIDYENFEKTYFTPHFIDVELDIRSLVEKNNKQIEISPTIQSKNPAWDALFGDGSTVLSKALYLSPKYEYK